MSIINMTPTMTSNTTPAPYTVTCSSYLISHESYNGYHAFDDSTKYSHWVSDHGDTVKSLTFDFKKDTFISGFIIKWGNMQEDQVDNFSVYGWDKNNITHKLMTIDFPKITYHKNEFFMFDSNVLYSKYELRFTVTKYTTVSVYDLRFVYNNNDKLKAEIFKVVSDNKLFGQYAIPTEEVK